MRIITRDDIIDTYSKVVQRGSHFFFSKMTLNKSSRTKSAFNKTAVSSSNWWMIPMVKERWDRMITGNPATNYRQYLGEEFYKNAKGLKLLSLGSGSCGHELELAKYPQFEEIVCIDMAENRLKEAEVTANKENLSNLKFICTDLKNYDFPIEYYDIVLFNSSLHHFENVDELLEKRIKPCLKPKGHLIINEFVGPTRLQFPKEQIAAINQAIKLIDHPYRKRYKTNRLKNKYYGSGIIRMIIADPSECIDSESIIPAIHKHFDIVKERAYGGNILMSTLKDIAHHFMELDARKKEILLDLFKFEDAYLESNSSDFIFGIYKK